MLANVTTWRIDVLTAIVWLVSCADSALGPIETAPISPEPPAIAVPTSAPSATVKGAPTPTGSPALPTVDVWRPAPGATWQWQLEDLPVNQSFDVDVYDIDLFDNDQSVVAGLRAAGRKVVCYVSVGSWEEWRPDASQFPAAVIGNDYAGWAGEKWLDIRKYELLAPIISARFDMCKAKGFDAVEPDNVDGFTNDTGFPLTSQDQLKFNRWLANEAHVRGLSIGLKNDPDQILDLLDDFDWALTEDCFAEGWCDLMQPFIDTGKAVLSAEYTDSGMSTADFCQKTLALRLSAILKNRELDAFREACNGTVGGH